MLAVEELSKTKIDGRKLTHSQSEYIRIAAVKAVRENHQSPEQVIATFGLHRSRIYKWLNIYDTYGYEGLRSTKARGAEPKLQEKQQQQLAADLLKNPTQLKFEFALWTVNMVAELIERRYSVRYCSVQVGRLLKKWGLSRQKPLERAWQQDPEKVEEWLQIQYPAIQKEAKQEGRVIYFGDEAGFEATAQYGTTWAQRGETPVIAASGQRWKVNCISAINNQGKLRFMLYEEKFTAAVFIPFLMRLLHKQPQPVTLIVDGHRSHFTAAVQAYIESTKGKLKIYQLPPYSPELNPDELVWNNAKQKVAKKKYMKSGASFKEKVKETMEEIKQKTKLIAAFFSHPNVAYAM